MADVAASKVSCVCCGCAVTTSLPLHGAASRAMQGTALGGRFRCVLV